MPTSFFRNPFIFLAAIFVLGAVCIRALIAKPAPDFSLETVDGSTISLSALKGDVVLVDFWASWCPPCRASLPHIQHVSQDMALAGRGLKVLAVNAGETRDKIQGFLDARRSD